ncbi:hypothetical protein CAEBREN_03615 [Caenorhabditis brenneri]|uniref:Uncharacterized protein n=1 Tax=Caenorhabditis brenneri TaxID=135651 RepID=G0P327_CAEBE|nr:hypothetical protein CAEBREN_03615 [Caenorhabditis brenneri]
MPQERLEGYRGWCGVCTCNLLGHPTKQHDQENCLVPQANRLRFVATNTKSICKQCRARSDYHNECKPYEKECGRCANQGRPDQAHQPWMGFCGIPNEQVYTTLTNIRRAQYQRISGLSAQAPLAVQCYNDRPETVKPPGYDENLFGAPFFIDERQEIPPPIYQPQAEFRGLIPAHEVNGRWEVDREIDNLSIDFYLQEEGAAANAPQAVQLQINRFREEMRREEERARDQEQGAQAVAQLQAPVLPPQAAPAQANPAQAPPAQEQQAQEQPAEAPQAQAPPEQEQQAQEHPAEDPQAQAPLQEVQAPPSASLYQAQAFIQIRRPPQVIPLWKSLEVNPRVGIPTGEMEGPPGAEMDQLFKQLLLSFSAREELQEQKDRKVEKLSQGEDLQIWSMNRNFNKVWVMARLDKQRCDFLQQRAKEAAKSVEQEALQQDKAQRDTFWINIADLTANLKKISTNNDPSTIIDVLYPSLFGQGMRLSDLEYVDWKDPKFNIQWTHAYAELLLRVATLLLMTDFPSESLKTRLTDKFEEIEWQNPTSPIVMPTPRLFVKSPPEMKQQFFDAWIVAYAQYYLY